MASRAQPHRKPPNLKVPTMEERHPETRRVVDRLDPKMNDILDRSRPYASIHPPYQETDPPAHYSQKKGGVECFYDGQLRRVYRHGEGPVLPKVPSSPPPQKQAAPSIKPPPAEPEQAEDADEESHGYDHAISFGSGDPPPDEINLTAWALRQERHPFGAVRRAIEERFSRVVTTEADAIDFLIEQGVVTSEQLKAYNVLPPQSE